MAIMAIASGSINNSIARCNDLLPKHVCYVNVREWSHIVNYIPYRLLGPTQKQSFLLQDICSARYYTPRQYGILAQLVRAPR